MSFACLKLNPVTSVEDKENKGKAKHHEPKRWSKDDSRWMNAV